MLRSQKACRGWITTAAAQPTGCGAANMHRGNKSRRESVDQLLSAQREHRGHFIRRCEMGMDTKGTWG